MKSRNRQPFFSIVIPTYNRSYYLSLTINSVLKQDFSDYEIIISDNNSTDDTGEIVRQFQKTTDKIRYFKLNKNITGSENVLNCYKHSKGKYIFNLFDDDLILRPDTLSYLHKIAFQYKPGLIKIGAIFYFEKFHSLKDIYKGFLFKNKLEIIDKNDPDFILKINDKALEFGSGNIFFRDEKEFNLLNSDDILFYHLPYTYKLVEKYGATIIGNHYIFGRFFVKGHFVYNFLEPSFSLDTQLDLSKKYFKNNIAYDRFSNSLCRSWLFSIVNLRIGVPTIMLIKSILRIKKRDNHKLINIPYYFLAIVSLFTPRFILEIIKKRYTRKFTIEVNNIIKEQKLKKYLIMIPKIDNR